MVSKREFYKINEDSGYLKTVFDIDRHACKNFLINAFM